MNAKKATKKSAKANEGSFPIAGRHELGYRKDQVDAFLERARATYDSQDIENPMTAAEIRGNAFDLKKRGYSARFVDAAMDRLEEVFFERERRVKIRELGEDAFWEEVGQQLREVRGRLARPRGKRFRRRGLFASGYRRSQVDAFLDRVAAMFAGEEALNTADVRAVVFHSQWRGYSEDQVDALLDAVIEVLLATR